MKPTISSVDKLLPLIFEKYLPSSFDNGFTIVEKINLVIEQLNRMGRITNEIVDRWNNLMDLLENDELKDYITEKMQEWVEDGTIERLLNDLLIEKYATIEWVNQKLAELVVIPTLDIALSVNYTDNTKISSTSYQFKSIKSAFDFIKMLKIKPLKINITSTDNPYAWVEQVLLTNIDMSNVTITGNYEINPVLFDQCYAIPSKPSNYEFIPALYGKMAKLPYLNGKFTMVDFSNPSNSSLIDNCVMCQSDGDLFTFVLADNSDIVAVSSNVVIKNFSRAGIVIANGSHMTSHAINIENIGNYSSLTSTNADSDGYGDGILCINSTLSANLMRAYHCGGTGANITQGSTADLDGSTFQENGHHNLLVTGGSNASIKEGNLISSLDDSLVAYADSHIDARNCTVVDNKTIGKNYGVIATRNASINFENSTCMQHEYGVMANRNSFIDCTNASIGNRKTSNESDTVRSALGSTVILSHATVLGNGSGDVCTAEHGGKLIMNGTTVNGGQYTKDCILCYSGLVFGQECYVSGTNADHGINCTRGGKVTLEYSQFNNFSKADSEAIQAYGGEVNINYSQINNTVRPLVATQGGKIVAYKVSVNSYTNATGILAYGGEILMKDSTIQNSNNSTNGIQATQGGYVMCVNSLLNVSGVALEVYNGGRIVATDSIQFEHPLASNDMNILPNEFNQNGNGYIIYNKVSNPPT